MILTQQFHYTDSTSILSDWCIASKNLYNQTLYIIKKEFEENKSSSDPTKCSDSLK